MMAAPLSSDIEVAEFAGQLFFRLWRASHTRTAEALKSVGLTPALFGLLNVLGGLSAAERRQLLALLHRALVSAPAQPPWRSEEGDG